MSRGEPTIGRGAPPGYSQQCGASHEEARVSSQPLTGMDPESPRELDEADVPPLSSAAGSSRFSMAAMDSLAARQETLTWYGQDPTSHTRRDEEVYAATLNERRKQVRRTHCLPFVCGPVPPVFPPDLLIVYVPMPRSRPVSRSTRIIFNESTRHRRFAIRRRRPSRMQSSDRRCRGDRLTRRTVRCAQRSFRSRPQASSRSPASCRLARHPS